MYGLRAFLGPTLSLLLGVVHPELGRECGCPGTCRGDGITSAPALITIVLSIPCSDDAGAKSWLIYAMIDALDHALLL